GCARRESSRAPGEKTRNEVTAMPKRLPALFLAALLLFSPAYAASIAVNLIDTAALVDENGVEIVAPGAYDFIFALDGEGGLFSGGSGENGVYRYALLNGAGERLTGQDYDMLTLEDGVV